MVRIEAWRRPKDWRVAVYSKHGEHYGYSTWLVVALLQAWRRYRNHPSRGDNNV